MTARNGNGTSKSTQQESFSEPGRLRTFRRRLRPLPPDSLHSGSPIPQEAVSGHLVLSNGVSDSTIVARDIENLYEALFDGSRTPVNSTLGGTVHIAFRRSLVGKDATRGFITLTDRLPWSLDVRQGAVRLSADLASLDIERIRFSSGAKDLTIRLPRPRGVTPVEFFGGARRVTLILPPNAQYALSLMKGATDLQFDGQRYEALSGPQSLHTRSDSAGASSYRIQCRAGVKGMALLNAGDELTP